MTVPSPHPAQAMETAPPLTVASLAKMSIEDLLEVAREYEIDDEYITGLNQKGLHDFLRFYVCLGKSPSPTNSAPGAAPTEEAAPVDAPLQQRKPVMRESRSPSPRSPEGTNIPKHERARPPRDTHRPTIKTRVYKPPGIHRPHNRNALNRPSPEETPEPDSDDSALASTEVVKHAIHLLREYRKGNTALKTEADEAIVEVEKLHKDICDMKQAVMMRRTLRQRLEAYIPYQRLRPDTWDLDQVFPDIPRFIQTLHGEEHEVDAVDADNDPHLKELMDRNYSRNAQKLDRPTLNGNTGTRRDEAGDDENAEEENQVNRSLSSIDPEEATRADSAPVALANNDANAQFSSVATAPMKSQLLKMLISSISRDAYLTARRIGPVVPSMDLQAFSARLQADSAQGKLCRIDDVQTWVNVWRRVPGFFTDGEEKEWDAYMQLFNMVEAYFEVYRANRECGLQEERLNDEGDPMGPYELYWRDNCHLPLFPSQWAEAMKGYERYCEFSIVIKHERAHPSPSNEVPAALSRPIAGPSRETTVFSAPRDPRILKRTASQASLGHAAPDGSSKLPSQLPESLRASKQRKAGLSGDEVVRIRQRSQAEERRYDSAEEISPPPERVWKGKGRMIYTPPRPGGSPSGVGNVPSGSNPGDSPGKFPAAWMKAKPVDGPVQASLERRAASIESRRRSQGSGSGGSDADGLNIPSQRKTPPGRTPTRSPSPFPGENVRYRKLLDTPVGGEGETRYKRPPNSFGGYDPEAEPVSPSPAGPAPATIRRRFAKEASMQELAGMAIGSAISKAKASVTSLVRRMSGEFSSPARESASEGASGHANEPSSPTPVAGPSRVSEPSISAAGPSRHNNSPRRGDPRRATRSRVVATYTSTVPVVALPAASSAPAVVLPAAVAAPAPPPAAAVAPPPPPAAAVAPPPPAPAAAAVPAPIAPLAAAATLATPPGSPVERRLRSRTVKTKKN